MADATDGMGLDDWTQFMDAIGGPGDPGGLPDMSAYIDNGDGTFTDPATGIVYDQNGASTGQTDPNYDPGNASIGLDQNGNPIAGGGGTGTGSSGGGLGSILSGLGLGNVGGLGWLAALAPLLGGLYAANRTGKATDQVLAGIGNANTDIKSILGGPSAFAPYVSAGQNALTQASNMNWTPLAPQFGPLGGRPIPGQATAAQPTSMASLLRRR